MITKITYKKQGNNEDSWIKTFFDDSHTECTGTWVAPPEIVYEDPSKQNKEVEIWRIQYILDSMGKLDQIEPAMDQLPEPKRTQAKYLWLKGKTISSESETVKFIQSVLDLTDEEKDSIFDQAAAIKL